MIELKNVSKTYKSKKSNNTQALKNVSIKFPEKGMVFILGKSGSGKSTLLNIIGGLDKYDSGEMFVDGKSTKEFKERDFDSYRNTYIGFIFQEYNLLENYSIEQNVKLPLELQHIKVNTEDVKKVLETVGLEDLSKRKTNELSGGQKQRIAIARALIKKPEVILADEPTGNLDSQTSEQIWKILKDISKQQLVIVVSHDIEAADKYADNIIKIQDGEVISESNNIEVTSNKQFNLKKAKLPFFYSFKMGAGSLFHKKIRLILSGVLILFSLICFGVMLSAYTSDMNEQYLNLFEESGEEINVYLNKYNKTINQIEMIKDELITEEYDYDSYELQELDDSFITEVENKTNMDWNKVYTIDGNDGDIALEYASSLKSEDDMSYYYFIGQYATSFEFVVSDAISDSLIGNMPQNDDEIVISSYVADNIIYNGIYTAESEKFQPNSYDELISSNMYINLEDLTYVKIVGIIDYNSEITEKYSKLKDTIVGDVWGYSSNYSEEELDEINSLYNEFYSKIMDKYLKVYVTQSFITKMQNIETTYANVSFRYIYNNYSSYGDKVAYIDESLNVINNSGVETVTELNNNEIIINIGMLNMITDWNYSNLYYNNISDYSSDADFIQEFIKDNDIIGKTIKINVNSGELVSNEEQYIEYEIVGVVLGNDPDEYISTIYFSKDIIKPLITGIVHCNIAMTTITSTEELRQILKYYPIDNSDVISYSTISEAVLESAIMSYFIKYVGKYGVIFFLVFATIILMNFINSSIRFRKKEIGILRALGCRSVDIIKMFIYESLVLMVITLIISFVIIPNVLNTINNFVSTQLLINIDLFYFGINQVLEIAGIMIAIIILANIIPLTKVTKMRPIDAILNK